ncbi:hypothetical protein EON64_03535 [archaeon]|nr:MAG: hypothetical protein EON64_03535 [archaeon]
MYGYLFYHNNSSFSLSVSSSCRLIHNVGKNLLEHGEKLDAPVKDEIQAAIDAAKALDSNADLEKVKEQVQALTNASMKIGQAMYGNKGASGDTAGASADSKEGEPKTAEYEEKKDK